MKTIAQISSADAAAKIQPGHTLIVGGFGMTGHPVHVMHALAETGTGDLTYIGNNVGEVGLGAGRLLANGQIKKAVGSYFTSNRDAVRAVQDGTLAIDLLPQGTLAEAIRAGGAGLGGFFTPTSAGTPLAEGREVRTLQDKDMVFIEPLVGDVSVIRAKRADRAGNLQFHMTQNNFNAAAATASGLVIAEVDEVVEVGALDPNAVHVPGCFVDFLVVAPVTADDLGSSASIASSEKKVDAGRMQMAAAAMAEIEPGDIVNLGIGIPTLVADLVDSDGDIVLHTENGMLGVGPEPKAGGAMDYPVNAGKIPVTALDGASYFDSAASFAMIRGGHVDVAIMGGLQVDEAANFANWSVPGKALLGVGGAMDLASGATKLIVTMTHTDKEGTPKLVRSCTLPLTAPSVVDVVITDMAVFHFVDGQLTLRKLMPGVTLDDVAAKTEARYVVDLTAP